MSLALAAAVLPLVPIAAGDERLDKAKTFVSEAAQTQLAPDARERVMCLDRYRAGSICLTEAEWTEAIRLAALAPKPGPRAFIPMEVGRAPTSTPFSLASGPAYTRR